MNVNIKKNLCIFIIIVSLIFSAITLYSINRLQSFNGEFAYSAAVGDKNDIQLSRVIKICDSDRGYEFKLFGIIPIGKTQVKTAAPRYVKLGGYPLGIALKTDGMYITSKVNVVTKDGAVCPVENCDIKSGDILKSINGISVDSISQIGEIIKDEEEVTIEIKNKSGRKEYVIAPALDVLTGTKKLGILLQDQIEGIGTMTYSSDGKFYALGHTIKDMNGDDVIAKGGSIFQANILGCVKGQKGRAGELNGSFSTIGNAAGAITSNNNYGIYGTLKSNYDAEEVVMGGKSDAQPGSAYIYTTVDGTAPQKYEIQIIKTNHQNCPSEKSMVLRVTDKRLLDTTGGIVQGMSGSPIVQNGKLIGAVTHVFVSDPTKGYGVYIDWMKP